jgi:ankyrin repeat protein
VSVRTAALAAAPVLCAAVLAAAGDTRVADAAQRGDRAAVRALVKQAADVNGAQGDGMTALHWAVFNDDVEMVRLLVTAGANVRAATRVNAITPLLLAAENGSAPIVEILVGAGANPNAGSALGVTPLMMAAASGSVAAITALVARGADVNAAESTYGQTPLMFAAARNNAAAVEVLLEVGANASLATRVRQPAGRGGRGAGAGAGQDGGRGRGPRGAGAAGAAQAPVPAPAPAAAPPASPQAGEPPQSAQAQTPAPQPPAPPPQAADQATETAREAQEPMGGLTPLHYAARQGNLEAVRVLLDRGAEINQVTADRTSALMLAVINGRWDLAMYLLERGADPRIATMAGGTPLYRVIDLQWAPKSFYPQPDPRQQRVTYLELMQALLARGADPNARLTRTLWYTGYGFELDGLDMAGATPFFRAAQVADLEAMRLLVAAGADPNIPTNEGVTPLLAAAGDGYHGNDAIVVPAGRMPAVRYLVEACKADVNARDERGGAATSILHTNTRAYTPLHAAAARGDNEMILYLVSKGARVDLVGKNGLTTADMANGPRERIQPFPETVALLVKLGAKNNNRCVSC